MQNLKIILILIIFVVCNSCKEKLKKACIVVNIERAGKLVKLDTCVDGITNDELKEKLITISKTQYVNENSQTTVLIHSELGCKNEYTMIIQRSGNITPEVFITDEETTIMEKCALVGGKMVIRKLKSNENVLNQVEKLLNREISK